MKKLIATLILVIISYWTAISQENVRQVITLKNDWKFINKDLPNAQDPSLSVKNWESVSVPHDWAIKGPFDKEVDKQVVAIKQDGEKIPTEKTGRTGALPHIGVGWYRKSLDVSEVKSDSKVILLFEGAMSDAQVFINGKKVGGWPYGYNYFYFDISSFLSSDQENILAVRLENLPQSSRWYPGAGLYRKVQLIVKDKISFNQWGQYITTPYVTPELAKVKISSKVSSENTKVEAVIKDENGVVVAKKTTAQAYGNEFELEIPIENPKIWDIDTPHLYTAKMNLYQDDELKDSEEVKFGIRSIEYNADKGGFLLNGEVTKFKGVCLHHDLGPLGAAVNKAALRRQLTVLKDMGCNAIRSAHNMPSIEQLELCDEMGFLFLAESFDEWEKPKVKNGYNRLFKEWAEKDIVNLVHATRNHPSIVMWSSGNEVPDQFGSDGVKLVKWLQDIFHREDPTRPVTVGMDRVKEVMESGFGAIIDIPGLNYRTHLYKEAYEKFPQRLLLGSETASTISSRGIYKFPVVKTIGKEYEDGQTSSYDLGITSWSNVPEDDFILQDDNPWVIGQFVWTGFDYLGEPTPYNTYWPSRSSYFGMIDLAGIPKDRYYLYRSIWNTEEETLHILPHWNWEGREGQETPVFVYTNYASAELFVNGKSQGVQKKTKNGTKLERYRLMWMDVKYEPGELKVVAFDDNGNPVAENKIVTAGAPHHLKLEADRTTLKANGEDLSYITVSVVDKDGNICPTATNELSCKVKGAGEFKVICNGDATSLDVFHEPVMKTFSGKLVVTVQASNKPGDIVLEVKGRKLQTAKMILTTE